METVAAAAGEVGVEDAAAADDAVLGVDVEDGAVAAAGADAARVTLDGARAGADGTHIRNVCPDRRPLGACTDTTRLSGSRIMKV